MIEVSCVECNMRSSVREPMDTIRMQQRSILIIYITEVVLADPERDGKQMQVCKLNDIRHAAPAGLREHATHSTLDKPYC